ncbi:hypothetical protein Tdes44962_MAKER02382 [Teratosphaeria destructans]|uniref:Uncharacterized protein n=1 Tax=Teratosphaeria destructans TaxID=418781 RepID=A0A9W7STT2_9PEZI|nr:hypothetical protein Tdes44962_MAKER02382 [Teratosphaeria destructans]
MKTESRCVQSAYDAASPHLRAHALPPFCPKTFHAANVSCVPYIFNLGSERAFVIRKSYQVFVDVRHDGRASGIVNVDSVGLLRLAEGMLALEGKVGEMRGQRCSYEHLSSLRRTSTLALAR